MAIDTIVGLRLDTLYCNREDESQLGGANPYLWPALIALPSGITAFPEDDQFRVSIDDGMSNGDTASIPAAVGRLQLTFQSESLESRDLRILVITVLLNQRSTSNHIIKEGFLAFKNKLLDILLTNQNDHEAAAAALADAVSQAAHRAGTLWDGIKEFVGIPGDSLIGAAFLDTGGTKFPGGSMQVSLEINDAFSTNWFTVGGGALTVTPPDPNVPDPCHDFVLALNQGNTALQGAESKLAKLQEDLATASPTQKPQKLAAIAKYEAGPLKKAQDAVDRATRRLEQCRQLQSGGQPGAHART